MRRPALLLALLATLASCRSAGHGAGQPAAPNSAPLPALACVDTALATSSLVERVTATHDGDSTSRYVLLHNPPGPRSTSMRFTVAPHEMVVEFTWPGPWQGSVGMQPRQDARASELEAEGLTTIGTRLLKVVRARCAPTAAGQPECTRVTQGRGGRCTVGT